MSTEENKALVRRFFDEFVNQRNLTVADEVVGADFVVDPEGPSVRGPEGMKQVLQWLYGVFPDVRYTLEDLIAEGDKVAVRLRGTGTQRGEYKGVAATGRPVTYTEMMIFRIADGRIAEWWVVVDSLGVLRQVSAQVTP